MPRNSENPPPRVPLADLLARRRRIGDRVDAAVARVMAHGQFIMGPEVAELETALARFVGVRHVVTCANGTDALRLTLMAWGIGPGDAVLTSALTYVATAEAAALCGATPVFCDVSPDTLLFDPAGLATGTARARAAGLRPRVVIPVDLHGQPADYAAIVPAARELGLRVLADAAQSVGGSLNGRRVGGLADATATSFFPAKPLGCLGDGGAIFTDDDALAEVLRSLRVHGSGKDKYDTVRLGLNSRLDTLQAAVLLEHLAILPEELAAREAAARNYDAALAGRADIVRPVVRPEARSAWAQYAVALDDRDRTAAALNALGVSTGVHYPTPIHRLPPFRGALTASDALPASERAAARTLSLPMGPYLTVADQERVVDALVKATSGKT